jgi:hypothetical protein
VRRWDSGHVLAEPFSDAHVLANAAAFASAITHAEYDALTEALSALDALPAAP